MPVTVKVPLGSLAAVIKATMKKLPVAAREGQEISAERIAAFLRSISPVDTGQFKGSWAVASSTGAAREPKVENRAPHAGIIEAGARPHNVSREGVEALRDWARRVVRFAPVKGGVVGKHRALTADEADNEFAWFIDAIVWGIVNKLKKHGQKGHFLVANNLARFGRWTGEEVAIRVGKHLAGTA